MNSSLFGGVHPAVVLLYGLAALVLSMCVVQPVCCIVVYASVTIFGLLVEGASGLGRRLLLQLVVVLAIVAFNCFFSKYGTTVLFSVGPFLVTLESVAFGFCMGLVLVSAIRIFSLLGRLVSSDDALSLFGGRLPVVSLMVSMTLGLVPQLGMQAKEMGDVAKACTAIPGNDGTRGESASSKGAALYARMIATLSSNALEDSIVRADSMRARGWGGNVRRTSYRRRRFRGTDAVELAAVLALVALSSWGAWASVSASAFYPVLSVSTDALAYVAFSVLFVLPCVLAAAKGGSWKA